MTKPLRIGVVGVGAIGSSHARVLAEMPEVEFTGIFDADESRAAEISARFGAVAHSSLNRLAENVDAAVVATPTVTHADVARHLLDNGKHVLVEKPITVSVEEAQSLLDAANKAKCVLQIGHIERFNPVMRPLADLLDRPRFIEGHRLSPFPRRSLDIGVVLDLMIHDLELVLHLVRSPVAHVDAVGIPVLTRSEDIANARIRFENGCVANLTASRVSPEKMRKLRVFQGDCYLSLDYQNQEGMIYRKTGGQVVPEPVQIEKDEPLKLELSAFVKAVQLGRVPEVTGQDGAAALDLALEVTRLIGES